jgi:hypothetical protein
MMQMEDVLGYLEQFWRNTSQPISHRGQRRVWSDPDSQADRPGLDGIPLVEIMSLFPHLKMGMMEALGTGQTLALCPAL